MPKFYENNNFENQPVSQMFPVENKSPCTLEQPLQLNRKAICIQVTMSILVSFTILSNGMAYGFPAIALPSLTNASDPMAISDECASWFASINAVTVPIGGLIASMIMDTLGRKKTFYIINALSTVSWGIMAVASLSNKDIMFIQLITGRVLMGICGGLCTAPATIYAAEVSHPSIRGRLSVLSALTISLGILTMYTLGYFIPTNWRLTSGIAAIICFLSLLCNIVIPETPSWLASKGKIEEAEKSYRLFQGLSSKSDLSNLGLQKEIDALRQQGISRMRRNPETFGENIRRPEFYKPFVIMICFFTFQQFSGIFVVVVYAVNFTISAGVTMNPFLCAIFIGLTRFVTTVIVGIVMDKLGRREPSMLSGFLMSLCMFGLAAFKYYPLSTAEWIPILLIIGYIITSTMGLLTIPFSMIAEIYPQKVRGFAAGLTVAFAFTMCFCIVKIYPTMVHRLGDANVFIFYGIVSLFSVVFVYYFLPETKGKTLLEIEAMFKDKDEVQQEHEKLAY